MYEVFDQIKLVELDFQQRQKLKEGKIFKSFNNKLKNFVNLHFYIIKDNYQLQLYRAYVFENLKHLVRINRLSNRMFSTPLTFRDPEFKELNIESLVKTSCMFRCFPKLEKVFYLSIRPCSNMGLCIFLGLSSVFVLFVEICGCYIEKQIVGVVSTIGNNPAGIILIIYFIAYLSFSAYYFFFRFNLFGIVGIKRRKKSNVYSLFYSSSMFVYLTYPICINVFHLFIGTDNTCFEQALGKQELASIGPVSLFNLAPFIILFVVIMTIFNIFGRLLKKLGILFESDDETVLNTEDLEGLDKRLNKEVLETLEDFHEYKHALYRSNRSQSLIDKFI